jgi:hypothetical protein
MVAPAQNQPINANATPAGKSAEEQINTSRETTRRLEDAGNAIADAVAKAGSGGNR